MIKTLKKTIQTNINTANNPGDLTVITCNFKNASHSIEVGMYFNPNEEITVTWGDGTSNTVTNTDRFKRPLYHSYSYEFIQAHEDKNFIITVDGNIANFAEGNDVGGIPDPTVGIKPTIVGISPLCRKQYNATFLFSDCTNLKNIPEDLFDYCSIDDFHGCFSNSGITYVPKDLFKNAAVKSKFYDTFKDCHDLIKCDLEFDSANSSSFFIFNRMFQGCENLETVSKDLFKRVRKDVVFLHCFKGCPKLNVPDGLFDKWPLTDLAVIFE